jgi:hypothetical protein
VPPDVTVIEAVISFVFHNNVPVAFVVRVELPQLSTTVTIGAAGADFGDAKPEPAPLIHPLTVWVTV